MSANPHSIRLSIITPVFNAPRGYLTELADALLLQMPGLDAEWLLVDDGSDRADTLAALTALAQHAGVRLLRNAERRGAGAARNFGAAQSRGTWLYFIDADDLPVPGALGRLLGLLRSHPGVRWLAGGYEQFDDGLAPADLNVGVPAEDDPAVEHWPDAVRRLIFETLFNQGSYLVERSLFLEAGGFDERFRIGEDWLLWMRLAARGELYYCRLQVFWQRRGHGSLMSGPLSATAAIVAPYLAARRDPRFASHRRPLRWRIFRLYRLLAERNQALGRRTRAVRFAFLAAFWALNEPQQWINVLRAARGSALR